MSIEVWKDVSGFEGYYQVSNLGNVRSCDRVVTCGRNGYRKLKGKDLSCTINSVGYCVVLLQKDGVQKESWRVHRLVAIHFLEKPEGKDVINHIDHNRANNCVNNLEWCTNKENTAHMHAAGRNYSAFGKDNASTRLSDDDVRTIRELACTTSHRKIAKMYNVSPQHVDRIVSRERRGSVV